MPGSRYKFRIKAENCYGISDPGEESDAFDVAPGERLYIKSFYMVPGWVYNQYCISSNPLLICSTILL